MMCEANAFAYFGMQFYDLLPILTIPDWTRPSETLMMNSCKYSAATLKILGTEARA